MTEFTNKDILDYVSNVIHQNENYIEEHICDGTSDTQTLEQVTAQMICNAIKISTDISVQATINLLSHLNLIDLQVSEQVPHEDTSSSHLHLVWDSSHPDTTE